MESSEDDAGTATSASRRESAREKDVGQAEDVDATSCFQQDTSEARTSCETPAMSEDNFDGDSVPSPSAQDVNTSTEAILDMIDEIVDGPGAPKRLTSVADDIAEQSSELASTSSLHSMFIIPEVDATNSDPNTRPSDSQPLEPKIPLSATSANSDNSEHASVSDILLECPLHSGPAAEVIDTENMQLQICLSVPECRETSEPAPLQQLSVLQIEPETSSGCLQPDIPSSSFVSMVQDSPNVGECDNLERTVKCVTSSDNCDTVTVESAESTSSDTSVCENKLAAVEPLTRSPLRRRLVRPAPSDRRPDSTVSSTDDSQTIDVHTTGQSSSENIKDVSSSSDAVPIIHGNVKPEEIRNISEISICKAETTIAPPKKIKLIRQKAPLIHKDNALDIQTASSERDQCQSTSSDGILQDHALNVETSIVISTTKSLTEDNVQGPVTDELIVSTIEETSKIPTESSHKSNEYSNESPSLLVTNSEDQADISEKQSITPINVSCVSDASDCHDKNTDIGKDKEGGNSANSSILESKDVVPVKTDVVSAVVSESSMDIIEYKNQGTSRNSDGFTREKALDYIPLHMEIIPSPQEETDAEKNANSTQQDDNITAIKNDERKVPPIKLTLCSSKTESCTSETNSEESINVNKSSISSQDDSDAIKQVPKLTIKLSSKQSEEMKSPIPKLTIKPLKPPSEEDNSNSQVIPSITKLNIKPIPKPSDKKNEILSRNLVTDEVNKIGIKEQIPSITKLNIKPILKPPEKINDIHRKSSSSEISESEYSENDETTSTSDQASTSDQGTSDVVPKVTIKLGKPGTESEGKFYTEQNIPKLTIKGFHQSENDEQEPMSKLKLVISQSEENQLEKVPKLTIKTVSKSDSQPLSPKLTIKHIKPPENVNKEGDIPKIKISTECMDVKENAHVPKITIKPVTRSDVDTSNKIQKKTMVACDSPEHIPVITKLNIKPILKPVDEGETSQCLEDKVPVISKLNIKPVIKPKDNEVDSSIDVPKITKLNIKPLKNPGENTPEKKDCDVLNADIDENSIPIITKLNIKPIVKPDREDSLKDSGNQSSEAGNSSDDNTDHIPVVTKLNIKPIVKRNDAEDMPRPVVCNDQNIPVVTKLNIKPLVKPDEGVSPASPKRDITKKNEILNCTIPVVTKLNIKPVLKPEELELHRSKDENTDKPVKNPPLVMKINMKARADSSNSQNIAYNELVCNQRSESPIKSVNNSASASPRQTTSDKEERRHFKSDVSDDMLVEKQSFSQSDQSPKLNCIGGVEPKNANNEHSIEKTQFHEESEEKCTSPGAKTINRNDLLLTVAPLHDTKLEKRETLVHDINDKNRSPIHVNTRINAYDAKKEPLKIHSPGLQKMSVQNCTLLKKLLENTQQDVDKRLEDSVHIMSNSTVRTAKSDSYDVGYKHIENCSGQELEPCNTEKGSSEPCQSSESKTRNVQDTGNYSNSSLEAVKGSPKERHLRETNENITEPLEIIISEKVTNQTSGQDSPRIILKINKTDHGPSAKIITEEIVRPDTVQPSSPDNTQEMLNDKHVQKRHNANSRRKHSDESPNMPMGKRLRSSRIVENTEKTPIVKRNTGKRAVTTEISPPQNKEPELSVLETKRLKLGQLLCGNKPNLSITPVVARVTTAVSKPNVEIMESPKTLNHTLLRNENCSKNGNSKLHNILSNLQAKQAKQMQAMSFNESNCLEKVSSKPSEIESNTSTGSDTIERVQNCHPQVQEMMINENSDFRDFTTAAAEEMSQDPLEVDQLKIPSDNTDDSFNIPKIVEITPQPKKRGRPRKVPVSEGPKPISLPVPALEERPQRSLRLTRERPAILAKPRGGRGRGRGARRVVASPPPDPAPEPSPPQEGPSGTIDPTSARIKLPRMTEALDKMPGACSTPLSSRRRRSSVTETSELKVVLENSLLKEEEGDMKSPEMCGRPRSGRGSRGGRGRTPRSRGRGRGGGRGAVYMKETMGIYGRVCGPATTTVQLFEEETCMMDDNATPAKPSHLLDEDSQSSVKSSTNESSKMKKSKFADLFDSNKVWTAADVKEYTWPPPEKPDVEHQIMMIQEQVAMFLGVKSFKRRYPELKRRTVGGEERDYMLSKGVVTEALCDLGITAVEASEVLDIMLSDYPHKYEEYRSHQRERQLTEPQQPAEVKVEEKVLKVEIKIDPKLTEPKPEPPKVDPEKLRQELAAAAVASCGEWNARLNAGRRPACAELQSLGILRRRPPARAPPPSCRPPAGFYPHALLPGQYQHHYTRLHPDHLRYFPLNTVLAAPPAPPSPAASSSESEAEWGSRCSSSDDDLHHAPKRKKLTKVKRVSQNDGAGSSGASEVKTEGEVDTCRVCKLRLEANRKYTHERFLVCANCNAKLHPGCVELGPDTIRKCREYPWQCAECKSCCACRRPQDDDKMLFCDLCDRGFHIYCVGLHQVPQGRWHCMECAICKSCGARTPSGPPATVVGTPGSGAAGSVAGASGASGSGAEAEWHHQTRRGPGGHKVYSHSLCTPCARAYRIGRYCPLCERSFIGPKGTMQLVICKLCDRQLHQECVRQAGGRLNVLDYTCGVCRRGGITSRAAAVRLAPRTIATLFMAKRRFNKYAHRQYLASRVPRAPHPGPDPDEPDDDAPD